MSRNHAHAFSVADFMPPEPPIHDEPPPTKRFRAFDLQEALAAMDVAENESSSSAASLDPDSTLTVSAEENRRLLRQAFMKTNMEQQRRCARPNTDDEPTIDAPSPPIPPGIPSPLGDDDEQPEYQSAIAKICSRPTEAPKWSPAQLDLDLELDWASIMVPTPESESSGIRARAINAPPIPDDIPLPADEPPPQREGGGDRISLDYHRTSPGSVSPETIRAVISSRQAVRQGRADERRTWMIVAGIWVFALLVAGLFAFLLMTTKTSTISTSAPAVEEAPAASPAQPAETTAANE